MRFKTTDKVTNEIVLSGLNLILKKGSFFDVSKDKIGHHELVWAIHAGYVSAVDDEAHEASNAKKSIYVNDSKKTIVCHHLKSPLGPGDKAILLSADPICKELDKLVVAGIIKKMSEVVEQAKTEEVKVIAVQDSSSSQNNTTRKSFKKSSSSKKNVSKKEEAEIKKENAAKSIKLNSESNVVVTKPDGGQIFVGENNGEFNID
jgi:hypothetical protein